MKCLTVVVATLIATAPAWAAEQRFPVSLKGSVETEAGKTSITDQNLVSVPGNQLVLMIDTEEHIVAIEEWNRALTTKIDRDPALSGTQGLMENFRMGMITGAKASFMANLEMVDIDWDGDGTDDHDGDLHLIAKVKLDKVTGGIAKISAKVVGVLNDPVNGVSGGENKLLSGKLKTSGTAF